MSQSLLPAKEEATVCFAHVAYQMAQAFARRESGINHFQVWTREALNEQVSEAEVLVISGFWHDGLLDRAQKLRFVQSISAGTDQYPKEQMRRRGIRLASAAGVNSKAVSEHAMAQILALTRHIHTGRDHQQRKQWRGMISDRAQREAELSGKTMLIVGLGRIGGRLATLAKAFDMRVVATKRRVETAAGPVDEVHPPNELPGLLFQADFVVLTCPLTAETENLIDGSALSAMKPAAYLINMARGRVVNEPALIDALKSGRIAGAGLDCVWDEPLPVSSPLWEMEQVIITPHSGGETGKYEDAVIDILLENLDRLWHGESRLLNEVI
jgi:phosphoglycerate dehydrogenase-like enzyme